MRKLLQPSKSQRFLTVNNAIGFCLRVDQIENRYSSQKKYHVKFIFCLFVFYKKVNYVYCTDIKKIRNQTILQSPFKTFKVQHIATIFVFYIAVIYCYMLKDENKENLKHLKENKTHKNTDETNNSNKKERKKRALNKHKF